MASEGRAGGGGEFEVDDGVGAEAGERGAGDGLGGEVGGEARGKGVGFDAEGGEADAVDGDAVAGVEAGGEGGRGDGDAGCAFGGGDGEEGAGGFDEAGEHRYQGTVVGSQLSGVSEVSVRWPGVVEVAGDAGVWTVGGSGDAAEGLLEEIGGGDALGEGEGLVA